MRILMHEFDKNRAFVPLVSVSQIKPHYFYAWPGGGTGGAVPGRLNGREAEPGCFMRITRGNALTRV